MVQGVINDSAKQVREPAGLALSKQGRQLWQSGSARHTFVSRAGVRVPLENWCYNAKAGWDVVGVMGRLNGAGRVRRNEFYIAPSSLASEGAKLYQGFRWFHAAPSTAAALAADFEDGPGPTSTVTELFATVRSFTEDVDELAALIRGLVR